MPDFVTFDDTDDSLEYSDVEEVTIGFAQNGCVLTFWGRLDGDYKEFKVVYPSLYIACDMIKDLESCRK